MICKKTLGMSPIKIYIYKHNKYFLFKHGEHWTGFQCTLFFDSDFEIIKFSVWDFA